MRHAHVALAAVIGIASCGDNSFPIDIVAPQTLDAYCERAARCGLYRDENACLFQLHLTDFALLPRVQKLQDPQFAAAVGSGTLHFDEAAAPACIAQIAALSCNRASEDARIDPPACASMFSGTIAMGEACNFDDECVSGRCAPPEQCPDDYSCCPGVCTTPAHSVGSGSACSIDGDCEVGTFCSGAGCAPLIAVGQECSNSGECAFGLLCISPAIGQSGTCTVAPELGEPCAMGQCGDIGARCDGSSSMCVPLSLAGGPCANDGDCGEDELCSGSNVCGVAPGLGSACTTECLPGSWCDPGGACVAPLANGMMCETPDQCVSGDCADGEFATTCIVKLVCI